MEGETFNPEGMVVSAVYSDGSRKEVSDYTVEPDGPLTVEDTAVIVTWNGMTAQVVISVRSGSSETPVITGIEITTAPDRTEYKAGEEFDPEGMVVSAVYSDGRRQTITDYTYEPSGALTTENTEITVSWGGMTAVQEISVSDASGNEQPGEVTDEPTRPSDENNGGGNGTGGTASGDDENKNDAASGNGTAVGGEAADTGDRTGIFTWVALLGVSAAAVLALYRRRKAE